MKKIKIPKRAIKDSIFSALVKRKKWLREVYISLYPSDKDIREEELEIVTLESIFVNGLYNDISFRVRDKLVVFIECQSTWSPNLPYRMIEYYGETIKKLVDDWDDKKYKNRKDYIPDPHFFCLYTGGRRDIPNWLYGSSNEGEKRKEFCMPVKVISRNNALGILKEICIFSEIYDKNRDKYGRTEIAIQKTIEECLKNEILVDFIKEHKEEVDEIMRNMSQEKRIRKFIDFSREEAREEGLLVGRAEGLLEGREAGIAIESCRVTETISSLTIPEELKKEILEALKK